MFHSPHCADDSLPEGRHFQGDVLAVERYGLQEWHCATQNPPEFRCFSVRSNIEAFCPQVILANAIKLSLFHMSICHHTPIYIHVYIYILNYTYTYIYTYYIYTPCTFFSFTTSGSKVWKLHLLWWRCWRPSTMGWLRPLPGLRPSRMFIKIMEMWMFMCACVYLCLYIYMCVCEREREGVCVYIYI